MSDESSTLDLVSTVSEFSEVHDYLEDEDVDLVLARIVRLCAQPNVQPHTAAKLVIELQAMSAKFAVLATYYQGIGKKGTEESHRKNMYYTLRDATARLSDALKYAARSDR
jgi:hypothetical protein